MQTDEKTVGGDGAEWLCAELDRAIERARRDDYDLPSEAAVDRARTLFRRLSQRFGQLENLEMGVGIDGVVEVSTVTGRTYKVVHVGPSEGTISMVALDLDSKQVTWSGRDLADPEVVAQFERAV